MVRMNKTGNGETHKNEGKKRRELLILKREEKTFLNENRTGPGFDEILLGSVASIKTTVLLFAGVRCEIIQDTFSSANLSLELYW